MTKMSEADRQRIALVRRKRIFALRELGWTYKKIGAEYNITCERVRQIVLKRRRELSRQDVGNIKLNGRMIYVDLPVRIRNCLLNNDVYDLDDLTRWTERELLRWPNFGKVSLTLLKAACYRHSIVIGDRCMQPIRRTVT